MEEPATRQEHASQSFKCPRTHDLTGQAKGQWGSPQLGSLPEAPGVFMEEQDAHEKDEGHLRDAVDHTLERGRGERGW